jgi:hypothetical protein
MDDYLFRHIRVDHRPWLTGSRVEIAWSGNVVDFALGKVDARVEARDVGRGIAWRSGEIHTASGDRFWAILAIDAEQPHEHWETCVAYLDGDREVQLACQDSAGFAAWVGEIQEADPVFEFFPYTYRFLDEEIQSANGHINEDTGWSGAREDLEKHFGLGRQAGR